jgi:hypothetical protein
MTMQRARRLASVVVVASLGVAGLSACQSAPSVAAYVGSSERISQDRVDAVYKELQAGGSSPITHTDVLSVLVGSELIDKIATQQGVSAPADLQVPALAQALKVPATSEYAKLYAEWEGVTTALRAKVTATGTPTDADLHELFDALVAGKQVDPTTKFADFKSQLAQSQNMALVQQSVALRTEIEKASTQYGVRVNPRYQPAQLPILETLDQNTGQLISLMSTPIGPNDMVSPVSDAR